MPAVPKPRKRRKSAPRGLTRSPMKRRANQVVRDKERMAFCKTLPCVACLVTGRKQQSRTQADHLKTRGAGGKEVGNLIPHCAFHHDERHRVGIETYQAAYHLDLAVCAEQVEYLFRVSREA